jgi:hypothetical protein
MTASHPTWLELDAHHLGANDTGIAQHVASCASCTEYLKRLAEPVPVPMWLGRVERRRPRWHLRVAAGAGLALAASLLVSVFMPGDRVRPKGQPSVAVFARQKDRVELWDGRTRFRRGDAVRFEVYAGVSKHVTVTSPARVRLYDAAVASGQRTLLPLSFVFDADPGDETVFVVLSPDVLSDAALADALEHEPHDSKAWVIHLVLPKESP